MSFKIFSLVLWVLVLINVSFSWSSTVNTLMKSRSLLQLNNGLSPSIIESVAAGAQMAMDECKSVFKWDRWNCPQSAFSRQTNHLPTKEKAYTDAIIAAGIIYSITRDCSKGIIKGCGCDPKLQTKLQENSNLVQSLLSEEKKKMKIEKDWMWGGCSDDASFGENLVLRLLEDGQKFSDPQGFVSRHNNRVGREIIREKMLKTCKCHGVSGSCSFQTCWMQMPTFPQIAKQLRERYDKAIKISFERVKGGLTLGNNVRSLEAAEDSLPNNLVFLEESENFCFSNNATGWPGTKGRVCSKTNPNTVSLAEKRSCRNLCRTCGYKVRKQKKKINHRCNCKFIWCCEVECDVCVESVDEYHCV